ncbi:MAG TPA: SRPBCC family protein [Sphingobacteriaceae bacterium]
MESGFTKKIRHQNSTNRDNITVNLDWPERYASVLMGVTIFTSGIRNLGANPFPGLVKSVAGGYLMYRGVTGHCPLYSSIGKYNTTPLNVNIRHSFSVNRPREEVYRFWRQLDNLPAFMSHLKKVTVTGPRQSHWEVRLPGKVARLAWDAEIAEDQEGHMIGWQSVPGAVIHNAGKVEFKDTPDGAGTILDVVISYTPPAGGVGTAVGKLLNPVFERMVRRDLDNLKTYLEAQGTQPDSSMAEYMLNHTEQQML